MDICAAVLFSTLALTFGGYMLRIFTSETEVINLGIRVMHVISPAYFIFVFIEILSGSLRGTGACACDNAHDNAWCVCIPCSVGALYSASRHA